MDARHNCIADASHAAVCLWTVALEQQGRVLEESDDDDQEAGALNEHPREIYN